VRIEPQVNIPHTEHGTASVNIVLPFVKFLIRLERYEGALLYDKAQFYVRQDPTLWTDFAIGFHFQTEGLEIDSLDIGDVLQLNDRCRCLRCLINATRADVEA
jgi:hypothetical protein